MGSMQWSQPCSGCVAAVVATGTGRIADAGTGTSTSLWSKEVVSKYLIDVLFNHFYSHLLFIHDVS
jgi:hypothetical protein